MLINSVDKQKSLNKIKREISRCQRCKKGKIGKMVFGEGNPSAKIVFIGEAPGRKEAKTGRPFVGRSGKLLRSQIKKIGLKEEEVYITSPVKYLPKRITPSRLDIIHGKVHLDKQLFVINPKIIVLLGKTAAFSIFKKDISVLKDHGKIIKKDSIIYFITLHPAAAVRFVKNKKIFEKDFQKLKSLINKTK